VPSASAIDPHAYVTCEAGSWKSPGYSLCKLHPLSLIDRSASSKTVGLLDAQWKRLAGHLDAVPAALHRLPESIAHVAEALWMQALDAGRRRALREQRMTDRALAQEKERLELRSHVLTSREGEMEARFQNRNRNHCGTHRCERNKPSAMPNPPHCRS
jgi:hypothetical protein